MSFSSVQFSHSVVSDSLRPHKSQHARPPCPSPTPRVHSDSRPSSQWCHPAISSSIVPFSSCPQSLPASGSFPMSQLFAYVIRELQIKIIMRYHYPTIRMAKIQKTDNTKRRQRCGATELSFIAGRMQNGTAPVEDSLAVSYKIQHSLTIQSCNRAPQYLPQRVKDYVHTKICTQMFIAALFITIKIWKQPRCPSIGKCIKNWYIHVMKYYSKIKRDKWSGHKKIWRKIRWILLSEKWLCKVYRLYDWHSFLNICFIFYSCWVFVAVCRLSLVAESGSTLQMTCTGFSLLWLLLLWSTGSGVLGLQ